MNFINNLLLSLALNPIKLVVVATLTVALLSLAIALGWRYGRKRALIPGILALLGAAVIVIVLVRHGSLLLGDSTNLERLEGVELKSVIPSDDDWPQWRGPNRDGIGRAPGLRTDWNAQPPTELWRAPLGGGYSSLAVIGDSAWTQDYRNGQERVICLDADSGSERWSHAYPADYSGLRMGYASGPRATPTIHEGRVYTVGATGMFFCLEALPADGKAKVHWQHDLLAEFDGELPQWGVACSPLIEGNLVIVQPGGSRGSIAAFDRTSGRLVWAVLDDPSGYSSPMATTLAGVRQIVAFTGRRVVGLNPADGALLWSYDFPTQHHGNIATPIIAGDTVFVAAAYGSGCALIKIVRDGSGLAVEPVFRQKRLLRTHHMTGVLRDGHVYGSHDYRGDLTCLDLRTAKHVWEAPTVDKGSIILVEGHLIVLTEKGTLWLVEATPSGFQPKGKVANLMSSSETWALPALSKGRLFLRDSEKVVCLQIADEVMK